MTKEVFANTRKQRSISENEENEERENYNITDYNLENNHFIFHESLHEYLPDNISPDNFNRFMERMDELYEAMLDLVGSAPNNGGKLNIQSTDICGSNNGIQHAHIGVSGDTICWNARYIKSHILKTIENDNDHYWFEGTAHELGHMYHSTNPWVFHPERWASELAWLAIEKCEGKIRHDETLMSPMDIYGYLYSLKDAGERLDISLVQRLFVNNPDDFYDWNKDTFEFGWRTMKQVFRSYENPDYNQPLNLNNEGKVVDFVDRIADVLELDVDTLLEEYYSQYARDLFASIKEKSSIPDTFRVNNYTYRVSNGEATILDYDGAEESKLVIPSTLSGNSVTAIGKYVFRLSSVKHISITHRNCLHRTQTTKSS